MKNEELIKLSFTYPEGQERTVRVYVPEHDENETLPVIYMTDGQNLFEDELSSFRVGAWQELLKKQMPKNAREVLDFGCGPGFFSIILADF